MLFPLLRNHKIGILIICGIATIIILPEIRAEQAFSFAMGVIISENKNNKKINYKTGIFLIVIGILSLGVKQISIIRNAPQIIYNLVQLMIKLPSGLGICFCIISINKKIFLKPLSMVGKIAYELYLVHGYILENVNASINGCFAFWIFSLFIAIVLHELLTLIRKYMVMIMKVQ